MMIALLLLRNHHYKSQLSTTKPSSIFEHYKNPNEREQNEDTVSSLNHFLSPQGFLFTPKI